VVLVGLVVVQVALLVVEAAACMFQEEHQQVEPEILHRHPQHRELMAGMVTEHSQGRMRQAVVVALEKQAQQAQQVLEEKVGMVLFPRLVAQV
jgi:hypothetical protein